MTAYFYIYEQALPRPHSNKGKASPLLLLPTNVKNLPLSFVLLLTTLAYIVSNNSKIHVKFNKRLDSQTAYIQPTPQGHAWIRQAIP